jgi:hypothetical protein
VTHGADISPDLPGERGKPRRRRVDWDAISPLYRAGRKKLTEIAAEFGITDAAIVKHAKKHGWTRDLVGKIRAESDRQVAERLINQEAVSAAMAAGRAEVTEQRTIEVEARLQAQAIIAHRGDVRALRETVARLAEELEQQSGAPGLFSRLAELVSDDAGNEPPTRKAERAAAFQRALGLGGRVAIARQLADATRQLVQLERQVLNIGGESEGGAFEDFMMRIRRRLDSPAADIVDVDPAPPRADA